MVAVRGGLGRTRQRQIADALATWGRDRVRWRYADLGCAVAECNERASSHGLCRRHYDAWYKAQRRGRSTRIIPRAIGPAELLRGPERSHDCVAACETWWLAGLLEGEGSFTINRTKTWSYPVIAVEMCAEDTVARVARVLGSRRVTLRRPNNERWNLTFTTAVAGAAAARWMRTLRPLMGLRRTAAIDAALAAYHPIRLTEPPAICVVSGCAAPHRSRGLCHAHYMSWSRDVARGRAPRITPLR
jgi:hypothetical protein